MNRHTYRTKLEDVYQELYSINSKIEDFKYGSINEDYVTEEFNDIIDRLKEMVDKLVYIRDNR